MIENGQPDAARRDLGTNGEPDLIFDVDGDLRGEFVVERTPFRRGTDATDDLVPIEALGRAVGLDDDQRHLLDPLEGREAIGTRQAPPTATHRGALVGEA